MTNRAIFWFWVWGMNGLEPSWEPTSFRVAKTSASGNLHFFHVAKKVHLETYMFVAAVASWQPETCAPNSGHR